MPATMLLDVSDWDLTLDALDNMALATEPYSLAQDAASACRLFLGELYYNTTVGVPEWQDILGHTAKVELMRALFIEAAETVPNVKKAQVYIDSIIDRVVSGQVQVTDINGNTTVAALPTVAAPQ